ncbi:DHA1 family bicyclomycin/chloramphenicol resistance-like MFS transporter [Paraburkholderia sp. MM5496-R1]|uniref:multidrug effflux MFS transporter n=1 Tax=Paraburkholderia sp. MM5496-R1 TaxID=2991065 RepID=UPI003D258486
MRPGSSEILHIDINDSADAPVRIVSNEALEDEKTVETVAQGEHFQGGHSVRVLAILTVLMAFASISTNLYLPALPTMAQALHANAGSLELTISGFLGGFSVGQLAWGPAGDRYGRRSPIAVGLVLFVIGSVGCALSTNVGMIIGFRVVQGAGACAGVVLARAIVRDLYAGPRAAQAMSMLMSVMAAVPLLGPSVGSFILHLSSWRAIFWILAGVGVMTLASLRLLPETLPKERRNRDPVVYAFAAYGELLRHSRLLGYAGAGGFFYGGLYAFIAGAPFAYMTYYHVSPQAFGLLFGVSVIGIVLTNQLNSRLIPLVGSDRLMQLGTVVAALSGVSLAVTAWTKIGGLAGLVVPLFVFASMAGFIVANSIAGALNTYVSRAGAVSALVGSVQYGTGIFGSALVGIFANGTPKPLGVVIALMAVGSAISGVALVRTRPSP